MYNPNFKVFESEHFRKQVGLLTFTPSISEWIDGSKPSYSEESIKIYFYKGDL